jgi:tight adherence protein C
MASLIGQLFQINSIIMLLIALAVFATVVTVASPMFASDKLQGRIKGVAEERDRLRAAQRIALGGEARLREKKQTSLYSRLVDSLNLKKVFESETTRDSLRQAGFRSEKHLVTFLALRLIVPIVMAALVFIYASTVFAERFDSTLSRVGVSMGGLVLGFYVPALGLANMMKRRQFSIKRAWSDALDLLLICVESGMALEPSLARVAKEIGSASVPLAEELTLTVAELSYLQDRRKALDNLGKRVGLETVRSVVTSLVQSEKYGTPLGAALRTLAQENRDSRMSEAEKKAAALPPKLTVPMILFFLPVIFVVILGPSLILVLGYK